MIRVKTDSVVEWLLINRKASKRHLVLNYTGIIWDYKSSYVKPVIILSVYIQCVYLRVTWDCTGIFTELVYNLEPLKYPLSLSVFSPSELSHLHSRMLSQNPECCCGLCSCLCSVEAMSMSVSCVCVYVGGVFMELLSTGCLLQVIWGVWSCCVVARAVCSHCLIPLHQRS